MTYASHPPAGFTIPKASTDPTTATAPPAKLDVHEKSKIGAAAHRAKRLFPGPVGELLHREIDFYGMCGVRTDQTGLLPRLIDHVMTTAEPTP